MKNGDTPSDDFELHVFARESASTTLYLDDQKTRNYLKGDYNTATITVTLAGSEAAVEVSESGPRKAGSVKLDRVVFYGTSSVKTVTTPRSRPRKLKAAKRRWVGKDLAVSA